MKLSICIPLYNKSHGIGEVLESIHQQNLEDYEVVVTDNHSADNSLEIVQSWSDKMDLKIATLPYTFSPAENWCLALKLSTGDCVKLQLADDPVYPNGLQPLRAFLEKHENVDYVVGRTMPTDDQGKEITYGGVGAYFRDVHKFREKLKRDLTNDQKAMLLGGVPLGNNCFGDINALMLKRKCLKSLLPDWTYGGLFRTHVDYEMYLRLFCQYNGEFVDTIVSNFELNASSPAMKSHDPEYRLSVFTINEMTFLPTLLLGAAFRPVANCFSMFEVDYFLKQFTDRILEERKRALSFKMNLNQETTVQKVQGMHPKDMDSAMVYADIQKIAEAIPSHSHEDLIKLYNTGRHLCETHSDGNFICLGFDDPVPAIVLSLACRMYSKAERHVFVPSLTRMPKVEVLQRISFQYGLQEFLRVLPGRKIESMQRLRNHIGVLAGIALKHHPDFPIQRILEIFKNQTLPHTQMFIESISEEDKGAALKNNFSQNRDGIFISQKKFAINPQIQKDAFKEFQQGDPHDIGMICKMSPNERFQLYYAARCLLNPQTASPYFVEIGTYDGASAFMIAQAFGRNFKKFQGFTIDPRKSDALDTVIQQLFPHVKLLPIYSDQAPIRLQKIFQRENNNPSFIFIDGDPEYEAVLEDVENFYPMLQPNGIILLHNYIPTMNEQNGEDILTTYGTIPGARQVCHEILEKKFHAELLDLPIPYPEDLTPPQANKPMIEGVTSTLRAYRKPA